MEPIDYEQENRLNTLPHLASKWGFSCYEDDQENWRIQPQANDQGWYLRQERERWLLVVNHVPQILFQTSEASKFIERQRGDQDACLTQNAQTSPQPQRPIWEAFEEFADQLPEAVAATLPVDGSADHYL